MKDLKHIHFFEKLLNENNNELVKDAISKDKIAMAYSCFYAPEVLLNVDNSFSVRLRAPNTGSTQLGTYYLSNCLCGMSRAIVERGMEGGYNFLSGICATETCAQMNRALEHFKLLKLVDKEKFFINFLDMPLSVSDHAYDYVAKQYQDKVLIPMKENYGTDISKEAILDAVKRRNKLNAMMREISDFRKRDDVYLTGTEMHILNLVVKTCPLDLITPYIEETLEELKTRQPDPISNYRARIAVVGSEMDDFKFTELMEQCGALVVADRYCFGTFPGYEHIEVDEDNPLRSIAKHYLDTSMCPRFMSKDKKDERQEFIKTMVEDFKAEGVLYEALKFCDFWGYEKSLSSEITIHEYNIPAVCVETSYTVQSSGQLKTRVQAFVENLEIKRIAKGGGSNE